MVVLHRLAGGRSSQKTKLDEKLLCTPSRICSLWVSGGANCASEL
jgi:hypothetical protein